MPLSLLPLLHAFPAGGVRSCHFADPHIRFAQLYRNMASEQRFQDKSIIGFVFGDDNDIHADGLADLLGFESANTSPSSRSGCMKWAVVSNQPDAKR